MKRTAIYIRVSTSTQAQEGDSIPAQRDALRKYIDSHNDLIFAGEYIDEGVSGQKDDRDELQRLLSDVCAGKVDLILITKLDRLYRSIRHYLNMMDVLNKYGVGWQAIWENYETTTPQGRLIVNQMMSFAQFEAEQTGQRIRQVQAYKVAQGEVISGSTPPGFRIVNKHLVPDNNAHIIRQAFEFYSICGNLDKTMKQFDHHGIFPRTRAAWKDLLLNEKYIGCSRGNTNYCEPIIEIDLFEDVKRKLKMNVKCSQRHTYIFSGLIRCAECGRVMAGLCRKKRNGKIVNSKTYRCHKHYTTIERCGNSKTIQENILERYLLDQVRPQLQDIVMQAEVKAKTQTDTKSRKQTLERRLDRLKELYINELISLDEYKADRQAIISDLQALSMPEPITDTQSINELLKQPFEAIYATFNEEERRFFWRSIIKEIRFDSSRNITVFYLP